MLWTNLVVYYDNMSISVLDTLIFFSCLNFVMLAILLLLHYEEHQSLFYFIFSPKYCMSFSINCHWFQLCTIKIEIWSRNIYIVYQLLYYKLIFSNNMGTTFVLVWNKTYLWCNGKKWAQNWIDVHVWWTQKKSVVCQNTCGCYR